MRARAYVPVVFVWYRKQQYCLPPIHPEVYAVGWCSLCYDCFTHTYQISIQKKKAQSKSKSKNLINLKTAKCLDLCCCRLFLALYRSRSVLRACMSA